MKQQCKRKTVVLWKDEDYLLCTLNFGKWCLLLGQEAELLAFWFWISECPHSIGTFLVLKSFWKVALELVKEISIVTNVYFTENFGPNCTSLLTFVSNQTPFGTLYYYSFFNRNAPFCDAEKLLDSAWISEWPHFVTHLSEDLLKEDLSSAKLHCIYSTLGNPLD